jgi:hypothetical protein
VGQLAVENMGGVAYFAHIGGFVSGLILIGFFKAVGLTRNNDEYLD